MPLPLGDPGPVRDPGPPPPSRPFVRKVVRAARWLVPGPWVWFGGPRIMRGGRLIHGYVDALSPPKRRDRRFKTEEDGRFDLGATAMWHGVSDVELRRRLFARRRQTARLAYATFVVGALFLLAWLWRALSSPMTLVRMMSALEFLPFCLLFFLLSFYNALLNFQIRMGHTAGWREYLSTSEPFWPQ